MKPYATRYGAAFYVELAMLVRLSGNPVRLRFGSRGKADRFRKDAGTWLRPRGFRLQMRREWVTVSHD